MHRDSYGSARRNFKFRFFNGDDQIFAFNFKFPAAERFHLVPDGAGGLFDAGEQTIGRIFKPPE